MNDMEQKMDDLIEGGNNTYNAMCEQINDLEEKYNSLVERVIEKHKGYCPEVLEYKVPYKDIQKCGLIDCKDCWREVIDK